MSQRERARVFKQAWQQGTSVYIAVQSFMEAGIYPLRSDVVMKPVKLASIVVFEQNVNAETIEPKCAPSVKYIDSELQQQRGNTSAIPVIRCSNAVLVKGSLVEEGTTQLADRVLETSTEENSSLPAVVSDTSLSVANISPPTFFV